MKYSIVQIFSFLIISFGLLTSCNGDKTLEKQEMVDIKPVEVIEQVTYYITTVDNLRAREGELKSSKTRAEVFNSYIAFENFREGKYCHFIMRTLD